MSEGLPQDIAALSFEEALGELEGIVRALEAGQSSLEESIKAYERGALLRRHCQEKLRQAELRVEQISASGDGVTAKPMDPDGG